jgi:hypothetical protein
MEPRLIRGDLRFRPPLVASRLGPMPRPPWFAFVLQGSRSFLVTWALMATALWLDRYIARHWSEPRSDRRRSFLMGLWACTALAASMLK